MEYAHCAFLTCVPYSYMNEQKDFVHFLYSILFAYTSTCTYQLCMRAIQSIMKPMLYWIGFINLDHIVTKLVMMRHASFWFTSNLRYDEEELTAD